MELFEHIRRARREEGLSIRELAGRQHVHRRTVRQALQSALPPQEVAAGVLGGAEQRVHDGARGVVDGEQQGEARASLLERKPWGG